MLDYKPSTEFPKLKIPNNNNKIIEKPVQPVQPVQPVLVSGGSRKKSKKLRSWFIYFFWEKIGDQ